MEIIHKDDEFFIIRMSHAEMQALSESLVKMQRPEGLTRTQEFIVQSFISLGVKNKG
jgi:hypothetical protein